jgi:hypothetical protein
MNVIPSGARNLWRGGSIIYKKKYKNPPDPSAGEEGLGMTENLEKEHRA